MNGRIFVPVVMLGLAILTAPAAMEGLGFQATGLDLAPQASAIPPLCQQGLPPAVHQAVCRGWP